jgi:hypothetical protein
MGHLLSEDDLLHERGAAAAVFFRPRKPGPSSLKHLLLPSPKEFETRQHFIFGAMFFPVRGHVGSEPGADLVAKGELSGGEVEIHVWIAYQGRTVGWLGHYIIGRE